MASSTDFAEKAQNLEPGPHHQPSSTTTGLEESQVHRTQQRDVDPAAEEDERDTQNGIAALGASRSPTFVDSFDPESLRKTGTTSTQGKRREKLTLAQRSLRVTWAWFPASLSTGAMASLMSQQPYKFHGLMTIGKIFYILSLCVFSLLLTLIIARFVRKPRAIGTSLHHPSESFFFGGFWVAVALMIQGMQIYGVPACGPWLVKALRVLFWIYYSCAMLVAVLQYHVIFQVERLTPGDAMPAWIFPAYPFLVSGVLAATIAKTQPQQEAIDLLVAGVAGQGLGWILATFVYTVYLTRLIHNNMPDPSVRPGMFMSVGPAAYTCAGLISLGKQAKTSIPDDFLGSGTIAVGELWYKMSVPIGIFLWLMAIWFSALSAVSIVHSMRKMSFSLQWWSFIFPNAGLANATIQIGNALDSKAIQIAGSVITCLLVPLWFMCAFAHIRAVWNRELLAPGRDVGVDDVNIKHDIKKERSRMRKMSRVSSQQDGYQRYSPGGWDQDRSATY